ncbi:hypothetical protein HaLaN_01964 [Haematococcus lacustris]|uniref:Uncharacterized protein n=1 Tax=Haematococcus lacustris TaxID=44745 RepID=A0A699YJN9_HAELA|nr:hypothetical protein HaLaN_01964 [Haematococcus lacustris]
MNTRAGREVSSVDAQAPATSPFQALSESHYAGDGPAGVRPAVTSSVAAPQPTSVRAVAEPGRAAANPAAAGRESCSASCGLVSLEPEVYDALS